MYVVQPNARSFLLNKFVYVISAAVVNARFYRAALNAGRSSREKGVRSSVCLSNAWIVTKWKKNMSRFFTIRKII